MPIYAYRGVKKEELQAKRYTSEGKEYNLVHSEELIVPMRYKGEGISNANSQGWERNSSYYFKKLQHKHSEYFSKKNANRINKNESPVVDTKFSEYFPEYSNYKNEVLIHHHIGKDGQAVAVPASMHKGSGEIHIFENELGITDRAKLFSIQCSELNNNYDLKNKTADKFYEIINNHNNKEVDQDMAKSLVLTNDEYRQPTNEELMLSGENAIDNHMEILRDEMRNDGMEDGPEMEEIISARREESMSELRDGIYGNSSESIGGVSDYEDEYAFENSNNFIEEASEYQGTVEDGIYKSQFEEATYTSENIFKDDFETVDGILNESSNSIDESYDEEDFVVCEGIEETSMSDNSFAQASDMEDFQSYDSSIGVGFDKSFSDSMDSSILDSMDSTLDDSMEQTR